MPISYTGPLSRGISRMRWMLFSPFNLTKWFVLGFTAWLAVLADSSTWGGNSGPEIKSEIDPTDWDGTAAGIAEAIRNVIDHGFEIVLVMLILGLAIGIYLVLLWLSSRGTFMFLDNLVKNGAEVKAPWKQFGHLGDSLFVWRLVFKFICVLAIGPLIALAVLALLPFVAREGGGGMLLSIPVLVLLGTLFFVLVAVAAFVDFFLIHLIAPIMYRHDVSAMDAWRKFLPVLREHLGSFILYGLFVLVLWIAVGIAVVALGLLTCCIGWVLLAFPYIGSVLMLPVHTTFRSMDMEFLAQFGGDFDLVERFARPAA